jgi:hypothetical protein
VLPAEEPARSLDAIAWRPNMEKTPNHCRLPGDVVLLDPGLEAAAGSKVGGEAKQRAKPPKAKSIPWLLLKPCATKGTGTHVS